MKAVDKQKLIDDVMDVFKKNGNKISRDLYLREGKYSRKPIERIFGSWNGMLESLNLPINQKVIKGTKFAYTDKELSDNLLCIYREFGRCSASLVKKYATACLEVYQRRFGSINKAMEKVGIPTRKVGESKEASKVFKEISEILKSTFEAEKTFEWLINPETGRHLYVDAYFEQYNLVVEYNGLQHYQVCNYLPGDCEELLKKRQHRDELKEKLIKEHNINFLTIKYTIKNNRKEIIRLLSTVL